MATTKKTKCYIDPALHQNRQAMLMTAGDGFSFTTENEELRKAFKTLSQKNNLINVIQYAEQRLSKDGRIIVMLDEFDGTVSISIARSDMFNTVGKIFFKDKLAVINRLINHDDVAYNIRTTVTGEYVDNQVFTKDAGGTLKEVSLQGVNEKLPAEEQIPNRQYHAWANRANILPIKQMFNLPYMYELNDSKSAFWEKLADDAPAKGMIELMNHTLDQMYKELLLNKTRAFGSFTDAQLKKIKENPNSELSKFVSDFMIKVKAGAGTSNNIEVIQGDPKLQSYLEHGLQSLWDIYAHASGYSHKNSKVAVQTEDETNLTQKQEVATTKLKRNMRTFDWTDVIQKCFVILGVCKDMDDKAEDWTFKINENVIKSRLARLEESAVAVREGFSDVVEELQVLTEMEPEEAKKRAEELEAKAEAKVQKEMEIAMGTNPAQDPKGGQPNEDKPKTDKKAGEEE